MVTFPLLGKDYVQWLLERARLNLDADGAAGVFESLGSRPEPFRKALGQARLQLAVNPAQDADALSPPPAWPLKAFGMQKPIFSTPVASLPPLQSALLRKLAALTRCLGLTCAAQACFRPP